MTGASAVISTVPLTPCTERPTSIVVSRPTSTITRGWVNGAKPLEFTVSEYSPGRRLGTLKRPESSVVAASSLLVSLFLAVIEAPTTTSLFGFVTVPPIEPVTVDCAIALTAQNAERMREAKLKRRNLLITGELLRRISNVISISRASHRAQKLRLP